MLIFRDRGSRHLTVEEYYEAQSKVDGVVQRCTFKRYEISSIIRYVSGLHRKKNCTFTWGSKLCREDTIVTHLKNVDQGSWPPPIGGISPQILIN